MSLRNGGWKNALLGILLGLTAFALSRKWDDVGQHLANKDGERISRIEASVEAMEKRLDRIEDKLDRVLGRR